MVSSPVGRTGLQNCDLINQDLRKLLDDPDLIPFTEELFMSATELVSARPGHLGRGEAYEFLSEIKRWRQFFAPSSLYGHRLGAGVSILTRYAFAEYDDLLICDQLRIVPNGVGSPESSERIHTARSQSIPIIGFFGGSTVQGYGARLPEFTIPALVERLLRSTFGIDTVCLNFGVAGWTCTESLHLLIHEAAEIVDIGLFYDGWNCAHEAFLREQLRLGLVKDFPAPAVFPGTSLRHVEQDCLRSNLYSAKENATRSFRLLINHWIDRLAKSAGPAIRQFSNKLIQNHFSIGDGRLLRQRLDRFPLTRIQEEQLVARAAEQYLGVHGKIHKICAAWDIVDLHFFQPVLPNSLKSLTPREQTFAKNGLPWGRPHITSMCRDAVMRGSGRLAIIEDLSTALDDVEHEAFIDSGHLNRFGNFAVAQKIAARLAGEPLSAKSKSP